MSQSLCPSKKSIAELKAGCVETFGGKRDLTSLVELLMSKPS